jgi:integrase/recombinase XerC/integrase/recombinase XerD
MLKVGRVNIRWEDIDMAEIVLVKLVLHFSQCNKAEGKSPKTVAWYSEMLTSFVNFLKKTGLGETLADFTTANVRGFILYEQNRKVSPYTVQARVRSLKSFSSWLFREGYSDQNLLAQVKLPKAPVKMVEPLTDAEIDKLVNVQNPLTAIGCRDTAILITFLGTGLRESELSNLRFEDSNLEAGYLKVMGKGAKERVVPTGALVQKILWRYVFHFRPDPQNDFNNFLFLTLDGKKMQPNAIRLLLKRWGRKAGVPRLHAHLCRHTYATKFLTHNCGDVFRLQQILGHSTLEMVRRYVHYASTEAMIQGHVRSPVDQLDIKKLHSYKIDRILRTNKG